MKPETETKLHAVAAELAAILAGPVSFSYRPPETRYDNATGLRFNIGGDELAIRTDWQGEAKATFYLTTIQHRGVFATMPYNFRDISITASLTRPAASIAADIARRIVPQMREACAKMRENADATIEARQTVRDILGRFGIPESLAKIDQDGTRAQVYLHPVTLDIQGHSGSIQAEIDTRADDRIKPDTLIAFLSPIVAQLAAEHVAAIEAREQQRREIEARRARMEQETGRYVTEREVLIAMQDEFLAAYKPEADPA